MEKIKLFEDYNIINESKYSNTLKLVLKYWFFKTDEYDPLVRKIADVCSLAGYQENEIEELCDLISDFSNESYQRGINSTYMD